MKELQKGERLELAALRSGMSETTAARYRDGAAVKGQREARHYRTRPSPFAGVWPEIETLLEQSPGLEAKTIFELLGEEEGAEEGARGRGQSFGLRLGGIQ